MIVKILQVVVDRLIVGFSEFQIERKALIMQLNTG